MYRRIVLCAIIISIFTTSFFVWNRLNLSKPFVPCEKPITYTIGTFDKRFNISQKDFLNALTKAEAIWEKPIGKNLFVHEPKQGDLLVNLIYDKRQEVTSTLSGLENTLAENESNYKLLQNQYLVLKKEYDSAKTIYDARTSALDEKNISYQQMVETWNSGKRTSREQFDRLETERRVLETEIGTVKTLEAEINEKAKVINALVATLNHLAKTLNLTADKYNTIGATRGETFTGGLYTQTEGGRSIDIFEFSNREKLVRILAHELGHALGLEHIDNPDAIMYLLNEGDAEKLTQTDLVALRALCEVK